MQEITSKTSIPLIATLTAVPTLVGFIVWLSSIAFATTNAEKKIAELEQKQQNQNQLLISIKEDLTLVKYKLEIKEK